MPPISDKKARILVIDDDQEFAKVMSEYLSRWGYLAEVSRGGVEGIERVKNADFQMVITDVKVPDKDGMEILDAIKSINRNTMVLMITVNPTIDSAIKITKAGAYDCLSKPIDFKAMESIIREALERQTFFKRLGKLRGHALALLVSVPILLILAIVLAKLIMK